jgi:dTDP-4-amino-4,6-dideoxygalactose transaminase
MRRDLAPVFASLIEDGCFIDGAPVAAFERAFATFCARKYCVGVGSGTSALYLALKALNIGPGDEVITTAFSFVATAQAIVQTGAAVRFVDVERATCNLNPELIESAVTKRTRALLPVHLFGQPANMAAIQRIARRHRLHIIEDAAQAHGALYRGKPVGSLGHLVCFSFYPSKQLGAVGDGGAVVTDNKALAQSIRRRGRHAPLSRSNYGHDGTNSRLDALQAAVLELKLRRLPMWTQRRHVIAARYHEQMSDLPLGLPAVLKDAQPSFHIFPIRVPAGRRSLLHKHLRESGVETRVYYPRPLPFLEGFKQYVSEGDRFSEAVRASKELLGLPMSPELNDVEVDYVIARIRAFFAAESMLHGVA